MGRVMAEPMEFALVDADGVVRQIIVADDDKFVRAYVADEANDWSHWRRVDQLQEPVVIGWVLQAGHLLPGQTIDATPDRLAAGRTVNVTYRSRVPGVLEVPVHINGELRVDAAGDPVPLQLAADGTGVLEVHADEAVDGVLAVAVGDVGVTVTVE
jgi:hypothetical protein